MVAGVATWVVVAGQVADENITVSDDADNFAGQQVNGPFTAYAQANVIQKHALEATGGLTFAELPQDAEVRQTAMPASFLRASLFTSVVSFGVATMAFGLGAVVILIGWALISLAKTPAALPVVAEPASPSGEPSE
ncbi:MAG: aromatic ring-opening dioxygenase LigA [Acidimicrobiales bacterium]